MVSMVLRRSPLIYDWTWQVMVAFSIIYNSGLNEYALYLDCEGDRTYHKGYEMTMSHLFKAYRKNTHTYKVTGFFIS